MWDLGVKVEYSDAIQEKGENKNGDKIRKSHLLCVRRGSTTNH